jgi:hypothetical protein
MTDTKEFRETTGAEILDAEGRALLSRKINELALQIQGTRLETAINQLYLELDAAGIAFKPKCYLADEWGCPQGVPVIGIPFYLADPQLCLLECDMTGVEAENDAEVMMYLRHEAGHAFNYAYLLHTDPQWRRVFGRYSRPYRETYKPVPFSTRFVRNIPGWYAQKHPDEDFAETFAVLITPDSNWRERYARTPAMAKLRHVEKLIARYGHRPPIVTAETLDTPAEQLEMTLAEWYGEFEDSEEGGPTLPAILDEDLRALFPASEGLPAADLVRANRAHLVRDINYWTGLERHVLRSLINALLLRVEAMGLKVEPNGAVERLTGLSIFVTTLTMNYLYTNQFVKA